MADSSMDDLSDPGFLEYLNQLFDGKPIEPDDQDFDRNAPANLTQHEAAEQYRLAQARTMMRLCRQWKASRN